MNRPRNRNIGGVFLTYKQAAEKSNLGLNTVMRLARESGALVKIGKAARVNWDIFYEHILLVYREGS